MRAKGFMKTAAKPLFLDVDFDYEKRKGVYIFKPFDTSVDFEHMLEKLEGKVLFPNVSPLGDMFRRVDCCWLKFEDPLVAEFITMVCGAVLAGGYPPQFEFAAAMLVEKQVDAGVRRDEAIVRAGFALVQAYATGALGEFKPSDFGYEKPASTERLQTDERESLYAGGLALWEVDEDGKEEAAHTLCAHAFRRVYAVSDEAKELDGRSVFNAIEYMCKKVGAKGYPHPARADAAYEIALMLESGELYFADELPDPFPHVNL